MRRVASLATFLGLALIGLGIVRVHAEGRSDFAQNRAKIRAERVLLRQQAEADRVKRAENAAAIIAQLTDLAAKNPVSGQQDDLKQLLDALRLLKPELALDLEKRLTELPPPPETVDRAVAAKWAQELHRQREAIVARPGSLLNKAVRLSLTDLAYDFLQEILAFDPDRDQLRKNLGQLKLRGKWYSPFSYLLAKQGIEWDDELGWILVSKRDAYEKDLYYQFEQAKWLSLNDLGEIKQDRRNWVALDKANEAHAAFEKPWTLRTQHLQIRGNAGLRVLVNASAKLEQFYAQIFAAYANFFTNKKDDYQLILGMADHPPLVVNIYKDKKDYVQRVGQEYGWSDGLFIPAEKVSVFYGQVTDAMYHEFTHQILHVFTGRCEAPPWLIEGIAVYTQDPTFDHGKLVLGNLQANRMVCLHLLAFKKDKDFPVEEMLRMSAYSEWADTAKKRPGIYPAAGSLAYFCMEADNRAYRADFVDFLKDSYRGPGFTRGNKLWDYLGMSKEEFLGAYRKWLQATSQRL
jgi:hypothetical protein